MMVIGINTVHLLATEAIGMDPSPLWYESIRHTFILAHSVTPLKWGWVHSNSLGHNRPYEAPECAPDSSRSRKAGQVDGAATLNDERAQSWPSCRPDHPWRILWPTRRHSGARNVGRRARNSGI